MRANAVGPPAWLRRQYLLGMILGNCMTGIALGLDTLTNGAATRRSAIEARLMLGGTRFEAM
jgi:UDP-glucose/iron transport system permease protein